MPALSFGVHGGDRGAAPFQQGHRTAASQEGHTLLLDQRLEWQGSFDRGLRADFDLVAEAAAAGDGSIGLECHGEADSGGAARRPRTGPEDRWHAPFGRQFACQCAGGGRLDELQCAVEVGLADAVGALEDGQPFGGEADAPERAVEFHFHFADEEAHG